MLIYFSTCCSTGGGLLAVSTDLCNTPICQKSRSERERFSSCGKFKETGWRSKWCSWQQEGANGEQNMFGRKKMTQNCLLPVSETSLTTHRNNSKLWATIFSLFIINCCVKYTNNKSNQKHNPTTLKHLRPSCDLHCVSTSRCVKWQRQNTV